MMDDLLKSVSNEHKAYLSKLRLEILSIQKLTLSISTKMKNLKDHEHLACPRTSRLALTGSSDFISIEEIYDAMKKYLMVLIQYFDNRGEKQSQFSLPNYVNAPTIFHLPTLCNMLWRRVEKINEKNVDRMLTTPTSSTEAGGVSSLCKSSQTENSSLMFCESCNLAMDIVKSLVYLILNTQRKYNVKETNVSKIRKKIGYEVFEMSQWGVMIKWTSAIRCDIEWLLSLAVSTSRKNYQLNLELEKLRQDCDRSKCNLQNDLDLIKKQLEAEKAQNKYLNQQIENLNNSLSRRLNREKEHSKIIYQQKEQIRSLGESLSSILDDCKQMKASIKSMRVMVKSKMLSQLRYISDIKNEITSVAKDLEDYFTETLLKESAKLQGIQKHSEEVENKLSDLNTFISELQGENLRLKEKFKILNEQKEIKDEEAKKFKGKVTELEKLFQEYQARENNYINNPGTPEIGNIKRDPVIDMENQRILNKQKIKALLRENSSLKITISKLKKNFNLSTTPETLDD